MSRQTTSINQHWVSKIEVTKSFLESTETHCCDIEIFDKDGNKLSEITLFGGDANEKIEIVLK
jgi:hypothetical protein